MPLPSFVQSDVLLARRLIELTCQALEKKKFDEQDISPLEYCFRLLEQYRYDAFNSRDAHKHEDKFTRTRREHEEEAMRTALHKTGAVVFPGQNPEQITVPLENALTRFCQGKSVNLAGVKKFFAQLEAELALTAP